MSALFSRQYQVMVGPPSHPGQAIYGNVPTGPLGVTTPLRCVFEIKKTPTASANKGKVSLYNMAAQTRSAITPGMLVTLSAGYVGNVRVAFNGVVAKSTSERQGPDVVTSMELGDGEAALSQVTIHRSYPNGSTLAQIITDIAVAMQAQTAANPTAITSGVAVGLPAVVYPLGYVAKGLVRHVMRSLCRSNGLQWSIQNGSLTIVPLGASTQETAEVISAQTGMLGVPSLNGQKVEFTCLINPSLSPGRLVQMNTATVQGFYVLQTVDLAGDSWGDKWECHCEGVFLPGASQALPASATLLGDTAVA